MLSLRADQTEHVFNWSDESRREFQASCATRVASIVTYFGESESVLFRGEGIVTSGRWRCGVQEASI